MLLSFTRAPLFSGLFSCTVNRIVLSLVFAVGINGDDFVDMFGGTLIFILLFYEPQN